MRLVAKLLNEQMQLLHRKGFDEISLGSPYKNGWLREELNISLTKAVKDMYYDKSPSTFSVRPVAILNEGRDRIQFELHYRLDPKSETLLITELTAQNERAAIAVVLNDTSELPRLQMP